MEKLYGLISSVLVLLTGVYLYMINIPSYLAGAIILTGVGLSLLFERRVIKEASTELEKAVSTLIPVFTEITLVFSVMLQTDYVLESAVYLGLAFFSVDLLTRFDQLFDINKSKLLGRISRVLVLALGLSVSGLNSFVMFYALALSGLIAVYDSAVILHESWSGI